MKGFDVPANVAEAVCQRWPDRGRAWHAAVGDELADLCSRYEARPVAVMRARYGFVLAVNARSGPLVFRGSPDPDAWGQAQIAEALADRGVAPRLHEVAETDTGIWSVMDRVIPGTPLATLPPTAKTPWMLAEMLRSLVSGAERSLSDLPPITEWLRSRLVDDNLADLAPGRAVAPKGQRQEALHVLDDLAGPSDGLCHGDASTLNILATNNEQFVLIDPRGMAGDPVYDVAVVALKSIRHISISESGRFFAEKLGLDPKNVGAWMSIADAARV